MLITQDARNKSMTLGTCHALVSSKRSSQNIIPMTISVPESVPDGCVQHARRWCLLSVFCKVLAVWCCCASTVWCQSERSQHLALQNRCYACASLTLPTNPVQVRVAAASDLKFVMPELVRAFEAANPTVRVTVVYGSSGNFCAQLKAGAPFDAFFSADVSYARELFAAGLTTTKPQQYALGRLVLWTTKHSGIDLRDGLAVLRKPHIRRIAIANPTHAPYGKRAQEALQRSAPVTLADGTSTTLWSTVRSAIIFADNIAQAAQYAQTGDAQVALLSLSLALAPALSEHGVYALVDSALHEPLEQAFVVMQPKKPSISAAERKRACEQFCAFVLTAPAQRILRRFGFSLPVP